MNKNVQNYSLLEQIGQGSFGSVFKGKHLTSNTIFAIKQMSLKQLEQVPKMYEFIMNEIEALQAIKNENIIKFHEVFRTQNNVYLVYEYCNGGTLESYIRKKKFIPENEVYF